MVVASFLFKTMLSIQEYIQIWNNRIGEDYHTGYPAVERIESPLNFWSLPQMITISINDHLPYNTRAKLLTDSSSISLITPPSINIQMGTGLFLFLLQNIISRMCSSMLIILLFTCCLVCLNLQQRLWNYFYKIYVTGHMRSPWRGGLRQWTLCTCK